MFGSGKGDSQDDGRLHGLNPICPVFPGDTWRSLESTDVLVTDVDLTTQGVIDVGSQDSSPEAVPDPSLDSMAPMPMSIDIQDPDEEVSPCEVPSPSSPRPLIRGHPCLSHIVDPLV